MNREANQENASLLSSNNINHNTTTTATTNDQESPRKPVLGGGGGGGGGGGCGGNSDRLKRDEWSEGAVSSLLEAYEAKWVLRNRAKLKGQDWEDVAKHVSARANSSKSPKTQTQCKNKIESMKKRYRSESATGGDASSWPLYPRLDLLLRGSAPPPPPPANHPPLVFVVEPSFPPQQSQPPPPPPQPLPPPPPPQNLQVENTPQNSHDSIGVDRRAKEDGMDEKLSDHISDKNAIETDSSTPALYSGKRKLMPERSKEKKKKQRKENLEIAESIRCLAEVVMRMEEARMDMMKEVERMRAEAELKRGEMDLKRTEIIANTQLEIAKLFAGIGKDVHDSSFRIGRI